MLVDTKLEMLCREVKRISNLDAIDPDIPLPDTGVKSLDITEILLVCEQIYELEIEMSLMDFDETMTLRDLTERLVALKEKSLKKIEDTNQR